MSLNKGNATEVPQAHLCYSKSSASFNLNTKKKFFSNPTSEKERLTSTYYIVLRQFLHPITNSWLYHLLKNPQTSSPSLIPKFLKHLVAK